MKVYKLMRILKNGDVTSLFINKSERIEFGRWMTAKSYPTKNFAYRPGFHTLLTPSAPHLSKAGRGWFEVEIKDFKTFSRPAGQGGVWYLSKKMRVNKQLTENEVNKIVAEHMRV